MILIEIAQESNHGINLFLNPETEVEITKKSGSLGRQVDFCFFEKLTNKLNFIPKFLF
jgi:hypothetical protein